MRAEIISIGTELLLGHIVNTNASLISKKMAEIGVDVYYHTTVGDNEERLSDTLKLALSRSDIIFTSGGLGPTVDDITASVISKAISRKLVFNKGVARTVKDYFKKRHRPVPKASLRQAYIPEGATWLKNDLGSAAGLVIPHGKKIIICLPGPPRELTSVVEKGVIPYLKKKIAANWCIKSRSIKLVGLPEVIVDRKVRDLLKLKPPTTVGIYAHLGEVELKITAKAKNEKTCKRNIRAIEYKIRKRLGPFIYGADDETLENALGRLFIKSGKTLAIAESCTGGFISNRITDVPGSSAYFKAGVVAYSNKIKTSLLGVPEEVLKKYGAVSRAVALLMAKGIRRVTGSDIGIGVTGISGPGGGPARHSLPYMAGGTKTKPVGLVYIAVARDKKAICKKCFFVGKRGEIKFLASQTALNLLRKDLAR